MGSPVSNTTAKIFLQYFEDKHIKHILDTKNVSLYVCYVNDIVIIYDSKKIHSDLITTNTNQIHKDMKLNPTHEDNGQIYFLDLLLIQKPTKIHINIF
jgi:tRNA A-37 threonylcarbamoyl transferase component Bud32